MKAEFINGALVIEAEGIEAMALRHWQHENLRFDYHYLANAQPYWKFGALRFKTPDVPEPKKH